MCSTCYASKPRSQRSLKSSVAPMWSAQNLRGRDMRINRRQTFRERFATCCLAILLLLAGEACSREANRPGIRIMPAGKEHSGFLSDYTRLKPNSEFENTTSYVSNDRVKNVHKYVAILIEPVIVYVATDADAKAIPDNGRAALANYFQQAITSAVSD